MSNELGNIQEGQYDFPYHHLITVRGDFTQSRVLFWGFEYRSYLEHVIKKLSSLPFSSLADVGCGDGKLVLEARTAFPDKRIVGIDYSERAIQFAKAFNPDGEFIVSDLISGNNVPPHGSFDIVTLIEVLEHIPPADARRFLQQAARLVRPGGYVLITVPSDNMPVNPKHYRHFNKKIMSESLDGIFDIETIEYLNKKSWIEKIPRHLFSNRFFILNFAPLNSLLYRFYERYLLPAGVRDGKRLLTIARKLR